MNNSQDKRRSLIIVQSSEESLIFKAKFGEGVGVWGMTFILNKINIIKYNDNIPNIIPQSEI